MACSFSRRRFMVNAAAAAGLHALAIEPIRAAVQPLSPGIQLFMVLAEFQKDAAGTLKTLAAIGYRYVEYFSMNGKKPSEFRKMADDVGLRSPCGHFVFGVEETGKLLDDAAIVGSHYVISSMLFPGPLKGFDFKAMIDQMNQLERDDFKRIAEKANEIGRMAKDRGLQYAYHNHNFEFRAFEHGETGYSIIMSETDPELVKFEADLGLMALGGEDPLAILQSAPKRFELLHFKDYAVLKPPVTMLGTEREQQMVNLGQGLMPLRQIIAEAKKIGIEYYIDDHSPPFKNETALEAARLDFDSLSRLLVS
jgi:sugar phosphate isomerase/epimerase